MKRLKLKGWVKVVLSLVIILVSIGVYSKTGELGQLAQISNSYLILCLLSWVWLLIGQLGLLYKVWE